MAEHLQLGPTRVDVELKDIKNVHLSVYPPLGHVRIAAPARMSLDTIRLYAISKLGWIRQQQRKIQEQERETVRDYVDRESHHVWGKRYLLTIQEEDRAPGVELRPNRLILHVRPGTDVERRHAVMEEWLREQVHGALEPLVPIWAKRLGVTVDRVHVRRMKTMWGSCNPGSRSIRLNTDLAKKPPACLEYIVVHELAHLVEPSHNARFVALMDAQLPTWRAVRTVLNSLPVRHEDWTW